jgi:hypothetical protein
VAPGCWRWRRGGEGLWCGEFYQPVRALLCEFADAIVVEEGLLGVVLGDVVGVVFVVDGGVVFGGVEGCFGAIY